MEIHPPHAAPLSFREVLLQLGIVTLGILIALSLEGTVQWWHHRTIVRETRERLVSEIKGNQGSIQTVIKSLQPVLDRFDRAIRVVGDLSKPGNAAEAAAIFTPGKDNVLSGISFAFFNTAAYSTAEVTGAFTYMDYGEVLKFADAYDLQAIYSRMQDTTERDLFSAATLGQSMLGKPTPVEIEDVKRQLRVAAGGVAIMQNVATKLDELYSRALTEAAAAR
jgi:hypothetical protein